MFENLIQNFHPAVLKKILDLPLFLYLNKSFDVADRNLFIAFHDDFKNT